MQVNDLFNNQFMFYSYLHKLNSDIFQYLENNNININYYCFFPK
jgi:hypothetical protein